MSDADARARDAAVLGHSGRWARGTAAALSALVADDPVPAVRRAALSALARRAHPTRMLASWLVAVRDRDDGVRRAAAELAPRLPGRGVPVTRITSELLALLDDSAPLVAEASAFALGEIGASDAVGALARNAGGHRDPLVREACVAALGALAGAGTADVDADEVLPVLLAAARDKPAIRRRAVIALAAFDGPEVERALAEAREDRDWQVRQLAEDLTTDD